MTRTTEPNRTYDAVDGWELNPRRRPGISRNFSGVVGFINVALTGSLAEASRRLGVSSPSLSKSIARLEAQLNVSLLERSNRKMTLTAEGEMFFEKCLPAVEQIIRIAGDLAGSKAEPSGYLRVNCSPSFGRKYIAKLLSSFSSSFPGIQIDLDLTDRSVDPLQSGVDVAIKYGEANEGDFVARKLCKSTLVICAAPSYLAKHGIPLSIDNLHQHKLILQRSADSGRSMEWMFYLKGKTARCNFSAHAVANDADLIQQAVLSGLGIAQLDSLQIGQHLESGDLQSLLIEYAPPDSGYFVCYRNSARTPQRVKVFVDYLFRYLGNW